MSSLLAISNKALRLLGVSEIQSLTQQGRAADRCNSAVRDIVKEVLRRHTWSHATVWDSFSRLATAPPFGYTYAYQAPLETIKIFDVRQDPDLKARPIQFDLVRGKIVYTDAEVCYARYIVYVESDLAQAPPDFIKACAYLLATEICIPLAKSNMMAAMDTGYVKTFNEAVADDTRDSKPRHTDVNRSCRLLSERGYPSAADAEEY